LLEGLGEEDLDTDHDNASLQLCSMEDELEGTQCAHREQWHHLRAMSSCTLLVQRNQPR
jgi:hypothetical protein